MHGCWVSRMEGVDGDVIGTAHEDVVRNEADDREAYQDGERLLRRGERETPW